MRDLKVWLNESGIKFAEKYARRPPYPYGIYAENVIVRTYGPFTLYDHVIVIDLYSDSIDEGAETKVESLLKDYFYQREREWLDDEKHFQTRYIIAFTEKG